MEFQKKTTNRFRSHFAASGMDLWHPLINSIDRIVSNGIKCLHILDSFQSPAAASALNQETYSWMAGRLALARLRSDPRPQQDTVSYAPLVRLALIGFGVGVSREIVKDIEDVRSDKRTGKQTLPNTIGVKTSHRLAYGLSAMCSMACWTPSYLRLFPSKLYIVAVATATIMCAAASQMRLQDGQSMLKKSIYVLLLVMIGSLI